MYDRKLQFHKMEDKKPEHNRAVLIEIKPKYRKIMRNFRFVFGHWNEYENVFELPDFHTPYCLDPKRVAGWTYNGRKEEDSEDG